MLLPQETLSMATNNGAAIILWLSCGTSVYFLKRFADSVDAMRRELWMLNKWVARIGQHVGVEEVMEVTRTRGVE